MSRWYYLDADNKVCGPVDFLSSQEDPRNYGWSDATRNEAFEIMQRNQDGRGHGIRPCSWERVRYTEVAEGCTVSTVFMSLDHGYNRNHPPLVFETLANWGFHYLDPPPEKSLDPDNPLWIKLVEASAALYEAHKDQAFPTEWGMNRYSTWEGAEAGHVLMVRKMQAEIVVEREKMSKIWAAAMSSVEP